MKPGTVRSRTSALGALAFFVSVLTCQSCETLGGFVRPASGGGAPTNGKQAQAPAPATKGDPTAVYKSGGPAEVRALLAGGVDVNGRSDSGWTPLMIAAGFNENPRVIEALIRAGAEISHSDDKGWTPIICASAMNPHPEIVRALISAGARLDARSNNGGTAAIWAAASNPNPEVLQVLLDAGVSVDEGDGSGMTLVFAATQFNENPEVLRLLASVGANVDARDRRGGTPLFYATLRSAEKVDILVSAGADVNAQDARGITPLMLAVSKGSGSLRVIDRLIRAGASPKLADRAGRNVLEYALENKELSAVALRRIVAASTIELPAGFVAGPEDTVVHAPSGTAFPAVFGRFAREAAYPASRAQGTVFVNYISRIPFPALLTEYIIRRGTTLQQEYLSARNAMLQVNQNLQPVLEQQTRDARLAVYVDPGTSGGESETLITVLGLRSISGWILKIRLSFKVNSKSAINGRAIEQFLDAVQWFTPTRPAHTLGASSPYGLLSY